MKKHILSIVFLLAASSIANAQWTASSLSSGRMWLAGAGGGSKAVFAGGIGMMSIPPSVYDLFTSSTSTMTSGTLSQGRTNLASASAGNWLVFGGGANDNILVHYNTVDFYNAATNTWTNSNALSAARAYLAGAAAGSKIAFAGGNDGNGVLNTVDIWDTLSQSWVTSQLSLARTHLAGAGAGTKLVFAGGNSYSGATVFDNVDIYDITTQTWSTAALSIARTNLTATAHGNKIYFAGGMGANNILSNRIDIYDVVTNTWTIDSLSLARQNLCSGIVADLVIFAGGSNAQATTPYNNVDIYNTVTGVWTTSTLTAGRFYAAAASVDNKFVIAGGLGNNPFPLNSVEIYTVGTVGLTHTTRNNEVEVMPNPTEGNITIKLADVSKVSSYNLFDISGKQMMQGTVSGSTSSLEINLESLQAGVYNLQLVYTDGSTASKKIIKN